MNALTESGRAFRDQQRNNLTSTLRKHDWFVRVPSPVLAGYAELLLISKTLRANIKREGIMRSDGTLNPCVEQFRQYKHTELNFLAMIFGARRDEMRRIFETEGDWGKLLALFARRAEAEEA